MIKNKFLETYENKVSEPLTGFVQQNTSKRITIYTDGACLKNPGGIGAAAYVIIEPGKEIIEGSSAYASTTNNRMEVMAAILALEQIEEDTEIEVCSDSEYLIRSMQGYYEKGKNRDLWDRLTKACRGKDVVWVWVKGHSGVKYNERCDELATEAMRGGVYLRDTGFEKTPEGKATGWKAGKGAEKLISVPEELAEMSIEKVPVEYLNSEAAELIIKFKNNPVRNFKAYKNLKTCGIDTISRWKAEELKNRAGAVVYDYVMSVFDEKDGETCVRWYLRGLALKDAVKKTQVDIEIRDNCLKSKKSW